MGMDLPLAGSLILATAALPYVVEVLRQVPLQTRFMAAMPAADRAALPPHPRRSWLTVFGSVRFFLALLRYTLRAGLDDPGEIVVLKRAMRRSVLREALFAAGFIATFVVLWRIGWRPVWPRLGR
jgi:hypothetical protein